MSKWLAVAAIGVLAVALIVVIVVYSNQTGKLNDELDEANQQITALQGQASSLQSNVTTLQGQLTQERNTVSTLQGQITDADKQVESLRSSLSSAQATVSARDNEIKTMRYPRHFASLVELTNWLQKDDTNTLYTNPTAVQKAQMSLILQIRAAREGYFMTVNLPVAGNIDLATNRVVIADVIYEVRAWDDFVQRWGTISPALPSYPITPESGQ